MVPEASRRQPCLGSSSGGPELRVGIGVLAKPRLTEAFCFPGLCALPSERTMTVDITKRNKNRIDL